VVHTPSHVAVLPIVATSQGLYTHLGNHSARNYLKMDLLEEQFVRTGGSSWFDCRASHALYYRFIVCISRQIEDVNLVKFRVLVALETLSCY